MGTVRAWKLSVGLATLILIALMAAVLVARGTVGYADWPTSDAPPAADEIVTVEDAPQPVVQDAPDEAAPVTVAEPAPAPATQVAPRQRVASERAESEDAQQAVEAEPEEVDKADDDPAEVAPESPVTPASEPERSAPQLARPDDHAAEDAYAEPAPGLETVQSEG